MAGQAQMVSQKFIGTTDKYAGVVVECEQDKFKGPYRLKVNPAKDVQGGPWEFTGVEGQFSTDDAVTVSVTTDRDGKVSQAVEKA